MFGDILHKRIKELSKTKYTSQKTMDSFWYCLRDIILEEIVNCDQNIESDEAIRTYYNILKANEKYLPSSVKKKLPSNNQEKYRVCNRNLWSSNAWHPIGLENEIATTLVLNTERKGYKRIYQGGKVVC